MTNPQDRDDAAMSAADETTAPPSLEKKPASPDLEKTTVVDNSAVAGATAMQAESSDPDSSVQAPYYESEWSPAYAQTEIQQTPNFQKSVDEGSPQAQFGGAPQPGYGDLTPQPNYGEPVPPQYPTPDPYGGYGAPNYGAPAAYVPAYPQPAAYGSPQAMPPQTNTTSAILAIVFSGLLVVGCYTTVIGIAPLVLGIMSLNKSNSVSRLWYVGQQQAAYDAVSSASNLAKWAWISMAIGFAVVILVVVVIIAIAVGNAP